MLPRITTKQNDICVLAKIPEQYDNHLIQLMQTAYKNSLLTAKCHIQKPDISLYGQS